MQKTFCYTYSAAQQEEIKNIRKKYLPKEEEVDKMQKLRQLDESVTRKSTLASVVLGTAGTLILGIGMCCTMVWKKNLFIPGIVIGLAGILIIAAAYPVYAIITKKEREKIAPKIISLADELMKSTLQLK